MTLFVPSHCAAASYLLHFESLFDSGRAYAFPCDEAGHVDMDSMTERSRLHYFYARAVVGRELFPPQVERSAAG